jgi:hypothetical protein
MNGYVITKNPLFRKKELEERIKGFDVSVGRLERDIRDIHEIIETGTNKAENKVPRREQLNKMERNLKTYANARDRDLEELTKLLQMKGGNRKSRRASRRPNKTRKMRKS